MRCPYCDCKLSFWQRILEAIETRFAKDTSSALIRSANRIR